MDRNDLSPAELRVWQAFPKGAFVDFRPDGDQEGAQNAVQNAAQGADWGPERTVRAEVLRSLLLNGPLEDGEIPSLDVAGARITGTLDLSHGSVDHAIKLTACYFENTPVVYASRLRQLHLSRSVLPGLAAATVQVEGMLKLSDCRFHGYVRLGGARIEGALFLNRAEVVPPDSEWPAIRLGHAAIGDNLYAPGLRVHGEVLLTGASVAGSVTFDDARLRHPGRAALDAQTVTVGNDFHMRRVRTEGWVGLRGARITGRLDLSYAHLSNPDGTALRAGSSTIGELWLRKGPLIEGTLNLRRAQIDVLFLEPEVVPDQVYFSGLTYTTLTPHEPAERRLPMLDRDQDGYLPHNYEQLSAAYLRVGDDHAARAVQLAKLRRHRRTLPRYGRVWGLLQEVTVGYGFRPMFAAAWLLSLFAIGSAAFAVHHPSPLKPEEAPDFDPAFFTLDLLLPVISFGQEGAFDPTGWQQALAYTLVISGWLLATTVFAGITRTVSRQ
ncbi:membrane-associated oxidoreductase [Streptomyces boluensis]|uniref:Membrane-associated oxidoreductase n=1 Tax=Streptomyces boluensis TaxID=1775135 RepID=A0A964UTU6_9ACTN|nr:membrane-associated oxidoreductase [Streptomyces boluensis]NBE54290.1 membrane-associated oxidoreductase [Streptomyces boluensis]